MLYLDPSAYHATIPSSFPGDWSDAGTWHNWHLYTVLSWMYALGNPPDDQNTVGLVTNYLTQQAQDLVNAGQMPAGGMTYVNNITSQLNNPPSITDPQPLINALGSIDQQVAGDPSVSDSFVRSISSIAYQSSIFWSVVKVGDTGTPLPLWSFWKWVVVIGSDIGGAVGDAANAATLGGSKGVQIGVGVASGAAASAAAGSS